ncbi:MAG: hypothetical protein ACFB03_01240 [Paracoccaceae bacterium]
MASLYRSPEILFPAGLMIMLSRRPERSVGLGQTLAPSNAPAKSRLREFPRSARLESGQSIDFMKESLSQFEAAFWNAKADPQPQIASRSGAG